MVRMIDTRGGSLHLDASGNWSSVTGLEAIRQKIERKLNLFQGEWFLDVEAGIPYRTRVFERPTSPAIITSLLNRAILEEDEVIRLASVSFDVNEQERTSSYSAQVSSIYGEFEVRL